MNANHVKTQSDKYTSKSGEKGTELTERFLQHVETHLRMNIKDDDLRNRDLELSSITETQSKVNKIPRIYVSKAGGPIYNRCD